MSYIGMELDALNVCPDVGDACGLTSAQVCHGLMKLWAFVFRTENEVVTAMQVQGFMYGSKLAPEALVAFGFLETGDAPDRFRVRGSKRLLGIRQARRAGGLAAKKNLIPGAFHRRKAAHGLAHGPADDLADDVAHEPHALALRCPSALTPTTDYRLPTEDKDIAGVAKSATPHMLLKGALIEEFKAHRHGDYVFDAAADGAAVNALLQKGKGDIAEIRRRWRIALAATAYPTCHGIKEFNKNFNAYTAPRDLRKRDIARGVAPPGEWTQQEMDDFNRADGAPGKAAPHG